MYLEEITEELNKEMEKKRRDEILLATLQEQAIKMHQEVYAKDFARSKKRYKTKIGFMLQSMFGKKKENGESIWLIKDLNVGQLYELIQTMSKKEKHLSHCCNAPLETRETEVPNFVHKFDPTAPVIKMARRRFCTKCGNRNLKSATKL